MNRSDVRHGLFGGSGTVEVWDLLGSQDAGPFRAALACELAPGGSVGTHVQEEYAEIVVGLDGAGTATVGGREIALHAGALCYLALGQTLSICNDSTEAPLRYLIIKAGS
jgi:quercetin dioxygenase-like cupin family protein